MSQTSNTPPTLLDVAKCMLQLGIKSICPRKNFEETLCIILCCCDKYNDIRINSKNMKQLCMNSMQEGQGLRDQGIYRETAIDFKRKISLNSDFKENFSLKTNFFKACYKVRKANGGKFPVDTLGFPDVVILPEGHQGPITEKSGAIIREIKFDDMNDKDRIKKQIKKYSQLDPDVKVLDRDKCECKDRKYDPSQDTEGAAELAKKGVDALKDMTEYTMPNALGELALDIFAVPPPFFGYDYKNFMEELEMGTNADMLELQYMFLKGDMGMSTAAAKAFDALKNTLSIIRNPIKIFKNIPKLVKSI